MLIQYHEAITRKALGQYFAPHALDSIVDANLRQDDLITGQIGHDEYHYDNNAFTRSDRYLEEQRELVYAGVENGVAPDAWIAFGKLTHTAQDFYAHSNYVDLWLARFDGEPPPPIEIAPMQDELIHSSDLHSGRLYYPLEALAFIPFVKRFVIPLLPSDSHAHMNLDSPEQGVRFAYAFEAAVNRTRYEFDKTVAGLSPGNVASYTGKPT